MEKDELQKEYERLCSDEEIISLLLDSMPVVALDLYEKLKQLKKSNEMAKKRLGVFVASGQSKSEEE